MRCKPNNCRHSDGFSITAAPPSNAARAAGVSAFRSVSTKSKGKMEIIIYLLAGLSVLLAIGGLSAYAESKHIGLLLSSVISISFSLLAIVLVQWWPLVVGFALNWGLRLLGLDPSARR